MGIAIFDPITAGAYTSGGVEIRRFIPAISYDLKNDLSGEATAEPTRPCSRRDGNAEAGTALTLLLAKRDSGTR